MVGLNLKKKIVFRMDLSFIFSVHLHESLISHVFVEDAWYTEEGKKTKGPRCFTPRLVLPYSMFSRVTYLAICSARRLSRHFSSFSEVGETPP